MARTARIQRTQSLYADENSDDENDVENETTPRVDRKRNKKRVSDAFIPGEDSERVPFKHVNLNDDEAEKRRRRKSLKALQPFASMDSIDMSATSQNKDDLQTTPKASRQKQQLLKSVVQTPIINVPLDVMSSNFEEWMKMATDNKINATNSWNFALIDYFHDMSLLRNNVDNSINFQKASCTLDGCVKIWTSRVDSVGTETGKLLSNLASEGRADDDDEPGSDNPDADPSQRAKRVAKATRPESTLAKNAAQLRSKKLELDFSIDPLFKKTSADFDEGGAGGLLMNHLNLGSGTEGCLRIIFDAGDSARKLDEEEETIEEPIDLIDLDLLGGDFIPDLTTLEDKAISHSLEGFSFAKDAFAFDGSTVMNATYREESVNGDEDDENEPFAHGSNESPMDLDQGTGFEGGAAEDFFTGDQAAGDEYGAYGGYDQEDPESFGQQAPDGSESRVEDSGQSRIGPYEPFDPSRMPSERDIIMAMTEAGANGSSLDYFDQTFLKNWAGPEHWKLRKVVRRPDPTTGAVASKPKRDKKEPFKIDFFTPSTRSQKEIIKEIFAPVGKGGSITLPHASSSKTSSKKTKSRKSKDKTRRIEQTLPDDMHFCSRQLVTLFLKPKFALKMRGHRSRLDVKDGEVDEHFWAQAAADQAAGTSMEDESQGGAIPFNTQFFHDDYDDGPGFDDIYDGDGDGAVSAADGMNTEASAAEQDLLAAVGNERRRARPEHVNYAKRAKRVDVRKLKENIWEGLGIVVPPSEDSMEISEPEGREPTDPEEARSFTSVITSLQKSYPKDKMDEISTSFCFICLLHLANEHGLKLEGATADQNLVGVSEDLEDRRVGDIWDLKIFRDPTATPSA